jgi:hypothetical protein
VQVFPGNRCYFHGANPIMLIPRGRSLVFMSNGFMGKLHFQGLMYISKMESLRPGNSSRIVVDKNLGGKSWQLKNFFFSFKFQPSHKRSTHVPAKAF